MQEKDILGRGQLVAKGLVLAYRCREEFLGHLRGLLLVWHWFGSVKSYRRWYICIGNVMPYFSASPPCMIKSTP